MAAGHDVPRSSAARPGFRRAAALLAEVLNETYESSLLPARVRRQCQVAVLAELI
jgi:hypothetical protein